MIKWISFSFQKLHFSHFSDHVFEKFTIRTTSSFSMIVSIGTFKVGRKKESLNFLAAIIY
jgi:hypothetical protein